MATVGVMGLFGKREPDDDKIRRLTQSFLAEYRIQGITQNMARAMAEMQVFGRATFDKRSADARVKSATESYKQPGMSQSAAGSTHMTPNPYDPSTWRSIAPGPAPTGARQGMHMGMAIIRLLAMGFAVWNVSTMLAILLLADAAFFYFWKKMRGHWMTMYLVTAGALTAVCMVVALVVLAR